MSETPRSGKWVDFVVAGDTGKTYIFDIVNKESRSVVGQVRWFGRWRRYALFPAADTVFEPRCLRDVADFLDQLMAERRPAGRAPKSVPTARARCTDLTPRSYAGHWRDWHRGHGCELDPAGARVRSVAEAPRG